MAILCFILLAIITYIVVIFGIVLVTTIIDQIVDDEFMLVFPNKTVEWLYEECFYFSRQTFLIPGVNIITFIIDVIVLGYLIFITR